VFDSLLELFGVLDSKSATGAANEEMIRERTRRAAGRAIICREKLEEKRSDRFVDVMVFKDVNPPK
jgi:hypothetical protein